MHVHVCVRVNLFRQGQMVRECGARRMPLHGLPIPLSTGHCRACTFFSNHGTKGFHTKKYK